jgi:hypothetical protein
VTRGRHRDGAWSVAALAQAVADQADEHRAAHVASLRRGPRVIVMDNGDLLFLNVLWITGDPGPVSFTLAPPAGGNGNFPLLERTPA